MTAVLCNNLPPTPTPRSVRPCFYRCVCRTSPSAPPSPPSCMHRSAFCSPKTIIVKSPARKKYDDNGQRRDTVGHWPILNIPFYSTNGTVEHLFSHTCQRHDVSTDIAQQSAVSFCFCSRNLVVNHTYPAEPFFVFSCLRCQLIQNDGLGVNYGPDVGRRFPRSSDRCRWVVSTACVSTANRPTYPSHRSFDQPALSSSQHSQQLQTPLLLLNYYHVKYIYCFKCNYLLVVFDSRYHDDNICISIYMICKISYTLHSLLIVTIITCSQSPYIRSKSTYSQFANRIMHSDSSPLDSRGVRGVDWRGRCASCIFLATYSSNRRRPYRMTFPLHLYPCDAVIRTCCVYERRKNLWPCINISIILSYRYRFSGHSATQLTFILPHS
ncbi:hypothetical protein QTP88_018217 [Uroleucon formosanum]